MLGISKENMNSLRIEEGKKMEIGQTGNPLDGTWTRPDPAMKNLLFVQKVKFLGIITLYTMIFSTMIFIFDSLMAAYLILVIILIIYFVVIISSYWAAQLAYQNHRFRITDEELIVENGIISLNTNMVPLSSLYDVVIVEGYWHRKYGIKSVMAGPCELMGLKNGDEVAEALLSRIKQAKARAEQ